MFSYLLKMSRPRFWLYLAGPYLIGIAFGLPDGQIFAVEPFVWYGLFYFLIPANVFLYGINDLYDRDTDAHNIKKTDKEVSLDQKSHQWVQSSVILSAALAIPLLSHTNIFVSYGTSAFLAIAWLYSAPPMRFKRVPVLDFTSNVLYIIPGIVSYGFYTETLPLFSVLIAGAAWTGAMHLYSAIPDIKPDKKANITTSAVYFGKKWSLILCAILWGVTARIALNFDIILAPAILYPLIPLYVLLQGASDALVIKVYWMFPYITGVLGFSLFLYGYFSH